MSDDLKRTLTAKDIAVVTMGTVIGSGIFLTPGGVMASSGKFAGMALTVWIVGGLLTLLGALAYAELGCMKTGAGGLYVYIRDAFGPLPAFLYGWTLFLVIASGSVAALGVAAGDNMAALIPLGAVGKKVVAFVVIASLAVINVRGTRQSASLLAVATVLKALALVVLIVVLPVVGHGFSEVTVAWPPSFDSTVLTGGLAAMISVLWAYEGWQYATFVGGEVKDPQRNFPRGLILGTLAIVVIYVLANIGYIAGLGPERLARSTTVASDAVGASFGPTAARLIAIPVLVSVISAAHGLLLTASRVFYAMARDGVFFKALGEVHPKLGTPANSIIALSVWAFLLAMSGTFNTLLTYVVFVGWIFYGLGGLCVIAYRVKEPDTPRPFKVPGYPITPILFVLSAVAIVLNTAIQTPIRGAIGIGGALLGVPVYFFWRRPG
jgi:basic amino acid/polyamine antiporter, APA family